MCGRNYLSFREAENAPDAPSAPLKLLPTIFKREFPPQRAVGELMGPSSCCLEREVKTRRARIRK